MLHPVIIHLIINYFYDTYLNQIDEELFDSYIDATIGDIKNEAQLRLSDETTFLWNEIVGHTYFWNKSDVFQQILKDKNQKKLTEIMNFYAYNMLSINKKWLSMQLYSNKTETFEYNDIIQSKYNLNYQDFND